MNWDDPIERAELIQRVGPAEYNRMIQQHHRDSTVASVNGRAIRPVGTRFGRLFMIEGTTVAFSTLDKATEHAATLPLLASPLDTLTIEFVAWCKANGKRQQCAREMYHEALVHEAEWTDAQRAYLKDFTTRWERAERE